MAYDLSAFVKEVLAQTDIVSVIQAHVSLKKAGHNFQGLCPFHHEKTPSFSVNPSKQFFYCFGCHASGDAINFLMRHENTTFLDTVELLASRLGMQMPSRQDNAPSIDRYIYELLREMVLRCRDDLLRSEKVSAYLSQRGIPLETARRFHVGYCGPTYQAWFNKAVIKHDALLKDNGLIASSGHRQPKFKQRLMFPIQDSRGKVIGFGGRSLTDQPPKYLNSPESTLFKKRYVLYGLYQFRKLKQNEVFIVEGYMDVLSLHGQGVPNVLACLGTAFTVHHWHLLKRYVQRVTFCFDGDRAGRSAAWKSMLAFMPVVDPSMTVNFLFLPDQYDPDSYVQEKGHQAFLDLASQAVSWVDFFIASLKQSFDLSSLNGRAAFLDKALTLTQPISNLSLKSMLDQELKQVARLSQSHGQSTHQPVSTRSSSRLERDIAQAVVLLCRKDDQPFIYKDRLENSIHHPLLHILNQWLTMLDEDSSFTGQVLMARYQGMPEYHQCSQLLAEHSTVYHRDQLLFVLLSIQCELIEQLTRERLNPGKQQLTPDDKSWLRRLIVRKKALETQRRALQRHVDACPQDHQTS